MGSLDSMNSAELVTYARDLGMVGAPPLFSERAVKTVFAYCQQEEEQEEEEAEGEEGDESEMVYSEFMEVNGAMGSQMVPDPYNMLEMRIDQFLGNTVNPAAVKHPRFKGKGLKPTEKLKVWWIEKLQKEKEEAEARGEGEDT